MWNTRYVRSLLVGDVGGIRLPHRPEDAAELAEEERQALAKAKNRAALVVALDWIGIVALFALRDRTGDFLPLALSPDLIFSIGVLAIAIHSGFRLGQLEKYRAIAESIEELEDRDQPPT